MPMRMCLGWRDQTCNARTPDTRCPTHKAMQRQVANARALPVEVRRPDRTHAERARRASAVREWRAEFGDWCPGWRVSAHASSDLTADHITPVAAGGAESGPLSVLCRSCNSRKKNRT